MVFVIAGIALVAVRYAAGQAGSGQAVPVLSPGVHNRTMLLDDKEGKLGIRYAISIPANYSPSNPVPLVLALHFGGEPYGAGGSVLNILVRPGLQESGAIIVAPDSTGGSGPLPKTSAP